MKTDISPKTLLGMYRRIDNGDNSAIGELPDGVVLVGDKFLRELYELSKAEKLDVYMTVDFNMRMIEDNEWFDGWSWEDKNEDETST